MIQRALHRYLSMVMIWKNLLMREGYRSVTRLLEHASLPHCQIGACTDFSDGGVN